MAADGEPNIAPEELDTQRRRAFGERPQRARPAACTRTGRGPRRRSSTAARDALGGPAVISQMDATTVLLPGDEAALDEWGNLHLEVPR
jgi:N-methylhydantoinase A/oxoprolinase/acetone carboxylase beta subunit